MVRYDKIFSIIDIKEENMKKWGKWSYVKI